jgi:hypothetical protein
MELTGFEAQSRMASGLGVRQMLYRTNGLAIRTLLSLFLASLCGLLVGCGSNGSTPPPGSPLVIVTQPASQTVPLNQTATFTVSVSGGVAPLHYQWTKDGAPIGGATSDSYVTSAVGLSDNNEMFVVTVTDSDGKVISNPATLTIGPRSPAPADLRFQQVAAPSTINGYGAATGESILISRLGFGIDPGIGTPLPLGPATCVEDPSPSIPGSCAWVVSVFPLPSGPDVSTNYFGNFLNYFDFDTGGNQPLQPITEPNTVVTSLHIASPANFFGIAFMTTKQTTGFQMEQHNVATSALQENATEEGLRSRVITAITYNAGQVEYYSYGWTNDPATIYEAKVTVASFDTVPAAASDLAAQGYIITAFGGNTTDGFLLVGTRVQGDSLPRLIRIVPLGQQTTQLWQPGYAIVAVLQNPDYSLTYIGER